MPTAGPLTAASTGLGISADRGDDRVVALAQRACRRPGGPPASGSKPAFRSAPEEKPRPAPVIITARTESSAAASSTAARRSCPNCSFHGVHRVRPVQLDARHGAVGGAATSWSRSRRIGRILRVGAARRWPRPTTADRHLHRARARPLDALGHARRSCSRRAYVDAVQAAGGIALMLPPDAEAAEHPTTSSTCLDGLILAGGADIDPATYGAERHPKTQRHAAGARRVRDRAGARARSSATSRCSASAAACRCMNVARGGTLDPAPARRRRPRGPPPRARARSTAPTTTCASRTARWPRAACGEIDHATKSHHHQAVDGARRGLRRDRLEHARRARRGDRGARARALALGVQWHPEVDPTLARRSRRWWRRRHVDARQPPQRHRDGIGRALERVEPPAAAKPSRIASK